MAKLTGTPESAGSPENALGHDLILLDFTVKDESKDLAKEFRARGMNVTAAQIRKRVDEYVLDALNNLADSFQEVAQDAVPKDIEHIHRGKLPFELEADHIQVKHASPGDYTACVYVDTAPHLGARRKKAIEAAGLAYWLNQVNQTRSLPSPYGASSKDWIVHAQLKWNQIKRIALQKGRH